MIMSTSTKMGSFNPFCQGRLEVGLVVKEEGLPAVRSPAFKFI